MEVQTTPNVSEIRRNNPSSGRNVQYSEKQVSTSTLHNSPGKHEHSSFKRIPPKYEGETMKGFRHGFGKYTFEDGSYYEGMWNFNRMQGQGKLYYASGKLAYEGGWSQDQIHGTGKLYNEHPRTTGSIDYKDLSKASHSWRTFEGTLFYLCRKLRIRHAQRQRHPHIRERGELHGQVRGRQDRGRRHFPRSQPHDSRLLVARPTKECVMRVLLMIALTRLMRSSCSEQPFIIRNGRLVRAVKGAEAEGTQRPR